MVCRCQQLMYVFPVLRWLKVFSQTWEGDVTMVLPSSFMQLKKSITNPTNKDLLDACKQVLLPPSPAYPLPTVARNRCPISRRIEHMGLAARGISLLHVAMHGHCAECMAYAVHDAQ